MTTGSHGGHNLNSCTYKNTSSLVTLEVVVMCLVTWLEYSYETSLERLPFYVITTTTITIITTSIITIITTIITTTAIIDIIITIQCILLGEC